MYVPTRLGMALPRYTYPPVIDREAPPVWLYSTIGSMSAPCVQVAPGG